MGQPGTNRLIPVLQRKPRHRDCNWQDEAYTAQDHEFAWVAAMNKVRNDIYERDVCDVKGEDSSPFVTIESQRPGCPSGIEFGGE
jgi:hypothetical protein